MSTAPRVATAILDALDDLDKAAAPLGLYGCHERHPDRPVSHLYLEWTEAVRPALARLGGHPIVARPPYDRVACDLAPIGHCAVILRRLAKIKVRRFGSAHRVDTRVDYAARWARADLSGLLNGLRHPGPQPRAALEIVVLIGFAREAHPFGQELGAMKNDMRGLEMIDRSWLDRYDRAFHVGLTAWWRRTGLLAA